ncbi:hypothetical protein [Nocardia higoensis]|uniref:hypothetical protein n=1 Tax=Nocardia higoensis TaxID=228599 RepID=UPI001E532840|nr:hypothetical protein [Nocardia higoensis]
MKRNIRRAAGIVGAACAIPVLFAGAAEAQPGTKHFSVGSVQCAIFGDGTVGCDLPSPTPLTYGQLPFGFPVSEIVIDVPWLPAHPTFDPGTPYTLPGGNPPLSEVKTGDGQWGPTIEHAGASCAVGFHGSFGCAAKGRGWSMWSGRLTA